MAADCISKPRVFLSFFFFSPLLSLRSEQPKGGEEMQRKELGSGFVVSSLHEAPPSLPRKRLSPKSRKPQPDRRLRFESVGRGEM